MGSYRVGQAALRLREPELGCTLLPGCPDDIDLIDAAPPHDFLRAAWYRAAGAERSLVVRRGDGAPVAAFPMVVAGPATVGAHAIPGCYWPFRLPRLAADLTDAEAAAMLRAPAFRSAMGPLWRVGPFYADDPAGARLVRAASAGGWTMLSRPIGQTFVMDFTALRAAGPWPRPSTLKRLRRCERQLEQSGAISCERITGADWSKAAFDALAEVEQASWVGRDTDGSGAKFIRPDARLFWEKTAADPALAAMLSALILRVGGRPVSFSFDLNVGDTQYGIAGSYDASLAKLNVGEIATYRSLEWAATRGIRYVDWGAGDSGYKTAAGADGGSEIIDCLFVRSPAVAALLKPRWQKAPAGENGDARMLPLGRRELLLIASLATAFSAVAMTE